MPAWKDFEELIANIHKELEPDAVVRHDHRVKGKSGRTRKLDVTITKKVGPCLVMIVFDCKYRKRPVNIDEIGAFYSQLQDVAALYGVMVSPSGYDAGAKAFALTNNITLLEYREAMDTDWRRVMAPESWVSITNRDVQVSSVLATLVDESTQLLHDQDVIFDENTNPAFSVSELVAQCKAQALMDPLLIGDFTLNYEMTAELTYVHNNPERQHLIGLCVKGHIDAFLYPINLQFGSGHVLAELGSDMTYHETLNSEGFDWRETVSHMEGVKLSQDDFITLALNSQQADLSNSLQYIRLQLIKNTPSS